MLSRAPKRRAKLKQMRRAIVILWVALLPMHAQPRRPQTPQPPFPYRSEDITIFSRAPGVKLACTLTVPDGGKAYPAMALVTGSGPQDRDETVFGHKTFLVIADYLARRGIGVLRCDDRGTGKSSGRFLGATTADFSLDAEAAYQYLSRRTDVTAVGIGGHSEGAVIAAMVASRRSDVSFVVMLAGTGVRGDEVSYAQGAAIRRARGASNAEIESYQSMARALVAMARRGSTEAEMLKVAREKYVSTPDAERIARLLADPWHRSFVGYDPAPMLSRIKCPVLVLNGDRDLQVLADQNVPAIEAALSKGGNQDVTVRRFPNLNHLFQTSTTGVPDEYPQIEETIAPVVLETMAEWLRKRK